MKKVLLLFLLFFFLAGSVKAAQSVQPKVLINEIAWMGTEESHYDEWIELYNSTDKKVNLEGWKIKSKDGSPTINLKGEIKAQSFFILERTDDQTLPEIKADQIYKGGLSNQGEHLSLIKNDQVVQEVKGGLRWKAGNKSSHKTMERALPAGRQGSEGWHSSREKGGTPKEENSDPIAKKQQMPDKPLTASLGDSSNFWFTLMIAFGVSFFSAAVIYFLRKELRKDIEDD